MNWKLASIQKDTEHRFLNLYTLHYEVNGKPYSYFVASRHENMADLRANNKEYRRSDGVLIVAYREGKEEKEILLVKVFRPALNAKCLEFPAGLLDIEDSDELEAAKREAKEETGVTLSHLELLMPSSPTSSGLSDEEVAVVMGEVTSQGEKSLEEFEDIDGGFYPLSKVKELLEDKDALIAANVRLICLLLLERWGK